MTDALRTQAPAAILMVRPVAFGFNPQTADTNPFQQQMIEPGADMQRRACAEFDRLLQRLRAAHIEALVVEDTEDPAKPDAVFPNNWISFHHDGTVVVYPMLAPIRRVERRNDVIEKVRSAGFKVSKVLDLTRNENEGRFLEGTGSVVFDHIHRTAYANISPRTNPDVLGELCEHLKYRPILFRATDENNQEISHTDMLMSIGDRFAVVCADAVSDAVERKLVVDSLRATEREIILIDRKQMRQFAGNMLQLQTRTGQAVIATSTQGVLAFRPEQRKAIQQYASIVEAPVPLLEGIEGGSVRSMMAGIHLPK